MGGSTSAVFNGSLNGSTEKVMNGKGLSNCHHSQLGMLCHPFTRDSSSVTNITMERIQMFIT